jgi:hypothetical protein
MASRETEAAIRSTVTFHLGWLREALGLGYRAIESIHLFCHQMNYHSGGNKRQASNRDDYHTLIGH